MSNPNELEALRAEMAEMRQQLQAVTEKANRADDTLEISNLQRIYGYYVDKGQWDQAADLFARDGTLEIAGRGVYKGQDRVRQYMNNFPKYERGVMFNHMQLQPVIHIASDRQTAEGRWRALIQIATLGVESRWGEAVYENRYVKEDGVWKIAALHAFITFYSEYERGWHHGGIELVRSFTGLQPDAPPTHDYEAWPEVYTPPYHYRNPVSGRE